MDHPTQKDSSLESEKSYEGRKRPSSGSSNAKQLAVKRFQGDDSAPPVLERQHTFTKEEQTQTFFIPVDTGRRENPKRRDELRRRFTERAATDNFVQHLPAEAPCRPSRPRPPPEPTTGPRPLRRQETFIIQPRKLGDGDSLREGEAAGDEAATVAELRAALEVLRRSRGAAQRAERAAKERLSRDAERTRVALQDLHERLGAARAALLAEKSALQRKLSSEFRKAMQEREAAWRHERERAQSQVRALEADLRSLKAQLSAAHAEAQRKATALEADMKRELHDRECTLRSQLADLTRQRDNLQHQLRERTRQEHPSNPSEPVAEIKRQSDENKLEARRKHSQQLQFTSSTEQTVTSEFRSSSTEAGHPLEDLNLKQRKALAEAKRRHDALASRLQDALKQLRELRAQPACECSQGGKKCVQGLRPLPRDAHGDEEVENEKSEGGPSTSPQSSPRRVPGTSGCRKRKNREEEYDIVSDNEKRRKHVQEQGRLRETDTIVQKPELKRDTNACNQRREGLMRHFHRLISLEPVSEADEYPLASLGLGRFGLGGPLGEPLGGSLMGSPLLSGPCSLSPVPGDVWHELAAGCGAGASDTSSGTSSPGGVVSPGGSPSPEQSHAVLYWQLMRDHLQLQRAYQQLQQLQASSRVNDRQARAKLEAQVYDLKRALSRRSNPGQGAALADALQNVVELRQREETLTAEVAELRDQNELLEFRLLELEGVVDKSSVCSAVSSTRDVCTDTESDTVTEDSGLPSLGASEDEDDNVALRQRLANLASSMQTEDDRGCLQRALQLLDSYQQQLNKHTTKVHRVVATVLPYTATKEDKDEKQEAGAAKLSSREDFRRKQEFFSQIHRIGTKPTKQADCLQESGIFEEEEDVDQQATVSTQTELSGNCECVKTMGTQLAEGSSFPAAFSLTKNTPTTPPLPPAAGALSEEILKLSQIRERFEEQGSVTKLKQVAPAMTSSAGQTQLQHKLRELEFFRTRASLLESKLAELERCSDPELRGCARLLERVAALERQAREAREAADLLVRQNRDLEFERCELEEAENDTRLRCQQLEVEVVQLREREGALEVELGRARRSLSAAQQLQQRLECALQTLETRNFELEEAECELRAAVAAVGSALPAIVGFHLAHYKSYLERRERLADCSLPAPVRSTGVSTEDLNEVDCVPRRAEPEVLARLEQLVAAEKDMHQKIAFLEQKESAFQETLAAADGLWTEMELNYKRRLARAEEAEDELRRKVRRLEDSESKLRQAVLDQTALSERIHELEAQEAALLTRIRGLEQEKQAVVEEAARFYEEMRAAKTALGDLQARVDGPMAQELAAEKRRAQELAEELRGKQEALAALEQRTSLEMSALQTQIATGERSLQDMEVTCAELREEVDTLEEAVTSLRTQLGAAQDRAERHLFQMESALAARDRLADQVRQAQVRGTSPPALVDEMAEAERQPEEDDEEETAPPPDASDSGPATETVSLFRKSLQAFRNSEMMMLMANNSKPATPPKPVPKKEMSVDGGRQRPEPFASLPALPVASRRPPPLPPKGAVCAKWPKQLDS